MLGLGLHAFDVGARLITLGRTRDEAPAKQSDLVIPTLDRMMKNAKIRFADVALIAVDIGPGSFTGVRVGLAVARTLAQALNVPLVGVSSLEAMAFSERRKFPSRTIVPIIPALSGEVYFAAYRGDKTVLSPRWRPEAELQKAIGREKAAVQVTTLADEDALAKAAVQRFLAKPASSEFHFENVNPLYLQPSWAERTKRQKR